MENLVNNILRAAREDFQQSQNNPNSQFSTQTLPPQPQFPTPPNTNLFPLNALGIPYGINNNFKENLANVWSEDKVKEIGQQLKSQIEEDIQSQEAYFLEIGELLDVMGISLKNSTAEDLPFDDACDVNSMTLFETLTYIEAIVASSLFPGQGGFDCKINGNTTPQNEEVATRKRYFYDLYLTQIAKEWKKETRRAIKWGVSTGTGPKKVFIDPVLNRPVSISIMPQDFIVNRQWSSHHLATRKTHRFNATAQQIEAQIAAGRYRDIPLADIESTNNTEDNPVIVALEEIRGIESSSQFLTHHLINGNNIIYPLFECHLLLKEKEDQRANGKYAPYIVTLDQEKGIVLDIQRNWKENDPQFTPLPFFVNYYFFLGFDGEGLGLVHYAKRLSEAATSIQRQIINSASYASFPGGLMASGLKLENNNFRNEPGEWLVVPNGGGSLKDAMMPFQYNDPSPALMQVLEQLQQAIQKPAGIMSQDMMATAQQAPMGSALWTFDSIQKVPNLILEQMHATLAEELQILDQRFEEWLAPTATYPFKVPGGEFVMIKSDFNNDITVVPSGWGVVKNSAYRFAEAQTMLQSAQQAPQLHDLRYAYEYYYKNMGLAQEVITGLLPAPTPAPPPFTGNPVSENAHLLQGQPVQAHIDQDHDAHQLVHSLILANPNTPPAVVAATQAHNQEHEAQKFLVAMQAKMGVQLPMDGTPLPIQVENQIAVQAAQVAQAELEKMQADKPQQIDPHVAELEREKMITDQKIFTEEKRAHMELIKLQWEKEKFEKEQKFKVLELEISNENAIMKNNLDIAKLEAVELKKENDVLREALSHQSSIVQRTNDHGYEPNAKPTI